MSAWSNWIGKLALTAAMIMLAEPLSAQVQQNQPPPQQQQHVVHGIQPQGIEQHQQQ